MTPPVEPEAAAFSELFDNQFTWTFRDFGEDITITAPE
jgi:hypothetical protein